MTDAEIMKGVKLCNGDLGNCKECPFDSIGKTCGIELAKAEIGLIERLQSENAALRERLEKAVELPRTEISPYDSNDMMLYYIEAGHIQQECFNNKFPEQLQARLAELKGGKHE